MLLSAGSVLVFAQSSSEVPEGLMNNPVYVVHLSVWIIQNIFVHVLNKYSAIKEEEFSGKVREKKQMKNKTVSHNKHVLVI